MEVSELKNVFKILKTEHYTFYRYGMIFFIPVQEPLNFSEFRKSM